MSGPKSTDPRIEWVLRVWRACDCKAATGTTEETVAGSATKEPSRARVVMVECGIQVNGGTAHRDIARLCGAMTACNEDFEMHTQRCEMAGSVRR